MQYRDFAYELRGDFRGWEWTVHLSPGRTVKGGGISKTIAIRNIKRTIDKAVANLPLQKKT